MANSQERQINQSAYRRLADSIKQSYPPGHFVAISGGRIVADADRFDDLRRTLQALGMDPADALIVQAGVEYFDAVILCQARQ